MTKQDCKKNIFNYEIYICYIGLYKLKIYVYFYMCGYIEIQTYASKSNTLKKSSES